ncbi:MAG: DNA mismatch repair endonuclease MutL [Candidatus Caenarcaniphilales bacterium]|nr:DNA mismatch repair endonuclease MutL [Candidatus Caenarcaniphilales bacterium]
MVNKITKLSSQIVNQIAAGEVVERPASAIKELVENSIDADATQIQVQVISNDGRSFRVIDNGSGINEEDLELAFSPHATSKIKDLRDLDALETMGFRGEALASISAVSRVTCTSKTSSSENAVKAQFNDQSELIKSPAAFSKGTCFEVRDLFWNVPARLKFLKRPETEMQAIHDVIRELAIANPEIGFELEAKGKKILKSTGSGDWQLSVKEAFQESINFQYLEITREEEPIMQLRGLIAPLSQARSDKRAIISFVNNRVVKCEIIQKAIRAVYKGFLPSGKYPRIILSLTLPSNEVDVNVHPTKKEVRYIKPQIVYQLIQNSLEKHLILQSNSKINDSANDLTSENENENSSSQLYVDTVAPQNDIISSQDKESLEKFEKQDEKKEKFQLAEKAEELGIKQFTLDKLDETELSKNLINAQESTNYQERNQLKGSKEINQAQTPLPSEVKNQDIGQLKHILKIGEMELRKSELKESNQSHKSDRGNSSDFTLNSGQFQISGQLNGPKWIREKFLETFSQFLLAVDLEWDSHQENFEQQNVIRAPNSTINKRPKIHLSKLEEIWKRDGWRCVYCGKYLLHPTLAKNALRDDPESWIQRLSKGNRLIKTHLLREHQASYDHLLPHSHNPSLSSNLDNLHACCRACNQEKSNSNNPLKWKPQNFEPWQEYEVKIGNLSFKGGDKGSGYSMLVNSIS